MAGLIKFLLLIVGGVLLVASRAACAPPLQASWESYDSRPDILSLPKSEALIIDDQWAQLRRAHFAFAALLLELYPKESPLYFLARDSEYLYDAAKLATAGTDEASRVHLLNVSRGNMSDPHLREYLEQNGITEEKLAQGQNYILVDTGFSGTIPQKISQLFQGKYRSQIKTQLLVSSNAEMPASRSFLININPMSNDIVQSSMHGTIVSYEHLPHYTNRSEQFALHDGRWQAISNSAEAVDGPVSKASAVSYMGDLNLYWSADATKNEFDENRKAIRKILDLLRSEYREKSIAELLILIENPQYKAFILDIFDAQKIVNSELRISLADLGITPAITQDAAASLSKKNKLIEKYPEWKPYLENPELGIRKLFAEKNWQVLGALIDAHVDYEFERILMVNLFNERSTGSKRQLQEAFINSAKGSIWDTLLSQWFKLPKKGEELDEDLFKLLVARSDEESLLTLIKDIPKSIYRISMADHRHIIEVTANKFPEAFYEYMTHTFTKLENAKTRELGPYAIQLASPTFLETFPEQMAKNPPPFFSEKDLFELLVAALIEREHQLTLYKVASHLVPLLHFSDQLDVFASQLIDKMESKYIIQFLDSFEGFNAKHYFLDVPRHFLKILQKVIKDPNLPRDFLNNYSAYLYERVWTPEQLAQRSEIIIFLVQNLNPSYRNDQMAIRNLALMSHRAPEKEREAIFNEMDKKLSETSKAELISLDKDYLFERYAAPDLKKRSCQELFRL